MRVCLLILLAVTAAGATDMIIREPQVLPGASNYTSLGRVDRPFKRVDADRYFRQGVELLPGAGSGNYQPASLNLTNWSAVGTNVLTNYVRWLDLVPRTVWTRQLTWSKTIYIPAATFDSNNVLATWTADGNPWRIDTTRILSTPTLPGVNDYEEQIGVFWTNAVGERLDFLLTDNYNGDIVATAGFNHYVRQHTFLVNAPSGNVVSITNRAVVTTADRNAGTNHLYFEVSKPQTIYGLP